MKKIGFIDYYLDEWHANNYVGWIREVTNGEMQVAYAYGEIPSVNTGATSEEWCERFQVKHCQTIEEVVERSDYLIVLSPDHCHRHYDLSKLALESGKPVFVDKTFAESKAEAERIFAVAKASPMFSSSALRFSKKLQAVAKDDIQSLVSFGGGCPVNYIIHQLEPIAVLMGTDVEKAMYTGHDSAHSWTLRYRDGRTAFVNMLPGAKFETKIVRAESTQNLAIDDDFFKYFIADLVKFYEDGKEPICRQETINIMAIRETCLKAMEQPDQWLNVV